MNNDIGEIGKSRKGRTYPHESLSRGDVEDILALCIKGPSRKGEAYPIALRDHAMITLFYRTGLRHEEVLNLVPHNVSKGKIDIMHGKGDEFRVVAIDKRTGESLKAWKTARATLKAPAGSPLFCTVKGGKCKPLFQSSVRDMLKSRARKAGVLKRITPHTLRHALAVELDEENVPMGGISQVLGHKHVSTTSAYLVTRNPKMGMEAIQDRE